MLVTLINLENIREWIIERWNNHSSLRTSIRNSKHIQSIILEKTKMLECKTFSQRCWHIINDIYEIPKCFCGKEIKTFRTNLINYYANTCSVKCSTNSDLVKEKYKSTCLVKYNSTNIFSSKSFIEKKHKRNREKHGVDEYFKTDEFREKSISTQFKKYNSLFVSTDKHKKNMKELNLRLYNVETFFSSDVFKEKSKATLLERYGVDHPMKNKEILEKMLNSSYYKKDFKLPSGNIIKVQGYEPLAINLLLKEYDEDDILFKLSDMPVIAYKLGNINRRYYSDIFIPKDNRLIEVKSSWTYKLQKSITLLKHEAAKLAGFNHEVWIFGKELEEIIK